ncbi:unnamed protein product [Closterium sp. NIES-54]
MYALSDSAEGDCYLSVPPDPGIAAAALGASASASPSTYESAAPGAGESALSGTAPTEALHTFTLDSGASRSFFRDSTTLTPLTRPIAVSLADPSGGPVLAHSSTVLPCPAAPSGLLSGLHLPSLSTNLVSGADFQDAWVDQFAPGGQRVTHCTCSRTGRHLATFTHWLGSSLYTLTTASPPVSASRQVAASSEVFAAASRSSPASAPCSCRPLSHETLLWHHHLGHPSLPRLQGMASRTLVSGLPRSLPPLPPGPTPTSIPCVVGGQRAAPHSSTFPLIEAPLQTLHMDVWGPARVRGQGHERYILLVVDDYSRYTTVFPLRNKGEVSESFGLGLPVLCLHSDRGGEFSSDLLKAFCRAEGIRQTFTLPASPQQNGIAERRIGMVMDVARTSMIHAAAPHFLWPFAVQYVAHQINLQPRFSLPETTPSLRWTGKVGMRPRSVSGDLELLSAILQRTSCPPMPFRAYSSVDSLPPQGPAPSCVSQVDPAESVEVAVDSGAARGAEPAGAGTGVAEPGGAEPEHVESGGAEPAGEGTGGAESGGAEPERVEPGGTVSWGAEPARAESEGSPGVPLRREPLSPQRLREWYARRCRCASGAAGAGAAGGAAGAGVAGGAAGAGAAGGTAGAGAAGGAAGAGLAGGAAGAGAAGGATGAGAAGGAAGAGAAGGAAGASAAGGATSAGAAAGAGAAGGATGASVARGAAGARHVHKHETLIEVRPNTFVFGPLLQFAPRGIRTCSRFARTRLHRRTVFSSANGCARVGANTNMFVFAPCSTLAGAAGGATGDADVGGAGTGAGGAPGVVTRDPGAEGSGAVSAVLGGAARLWPPLLVQSQSQLQLASPLPGPSPYSRPTRGLTERREPESRPVSLESRPDSPESRFESPVRTVRAGRRVTRPRPPPVPGTHSLTLCPSNAPQRVPLPSPPASSLPDNPDPESDSLRAASPTFTRFLDIAVTHPLLESTTVSALVADFAVAYRLDYATSLVAESASVCPPSVGGTYVDEVPPPGANIVSDLWIFRVKRPPGSAPVFKARYVARGFSQRQGVELFQTFSPTLKMTTLQVLLHVAAQREYELHSLDFSTAFLQGSLHEEIWLRRPPGFTGSFPAGTQWSLRRPVYGLRQAPREWHDTLRTTLATLGFAPSIADPSPFLRTDTTLPPFYVLVYVDDLIFATADIEALAHVKSELQKRHTCTDLGELTSFLGLWITRDRALRTITLTQSHMVQ